MPVIIAVIGGQADPSEETLRLATRVGQLIAKKGAYLICGGLEGVMQAACQGAKEAGGTTIGVLPSTSKDDANQYVDIPIVTGMGTARNVIIVRTADAVIAIDGRFGTLSEIAHALEQDKKVISLKSWPMSNLGVPQNLFVDVQSPKEAVELALDYATRKTR